MDDEKLIEKFTPKTSDNWKSEDSVELETLKKSRLLISRIVYDKEDPPKRCIAIEKNRKRVAFDIEMVPVVIAALKKLCPATFLPDELKGTI